MFNPAAAIAQCWHRPCSTAANVSERQAYNLRCHGPSTPTAAAVAQCSHRPSQCQCGACLQSALSRALHTSSSSHCSVPAPTQPMSVRGMLTICAVTGPAHQQQQPLLSARTDPASVSERHAYNLRCHGPCTLTVVYNKLSTANLRQPWHCICICSCFSKSTTLGNVCTKVHNTWQCLHCNPQHLAMSAL